MPQPVNLRLVRRIQNILGTSNPVKYDAARRVCVERVPELSDQNTEVSFDSGYVEYGDSVSETDSESPEPVVTPVPEPWSTIPLHERAELLSALESQCHSLQCLAKEHYWTQKPSHAEIDLTRKCNDCGSEPSNHLICVSVAMLTNRSGEAETRYRRRGLGMPVSPREEAVRGSYDTKK